MNAIRPILLAVLVLTLGCGDTLIDPFENEDRFFTIWGYLNVDDFEHEVRVIPVTRRGGVVADTVGEGSTIDATVVSIDLTSGRETMWDHRVQVLQDSTYGHVFRGFFQIVPGRTYRLEVRRSDGITAWAETTVPRLERTDRAILGPVRPAPSGGRVMDLTLDGIRMPLNIRVIYRVDAALPQRTTYISRYRTSGAPTADGSWKFTIDLERDMKLAQDSIRGQVTGEDKRAALREMGVRATVITDAWMPPGGIFDPDVLVNPGVLSNVNNGFGFWGSYNTYSQNWDVTEEFGSQFGWDY